MESICYVTKLSGFEYTKYIQPNKTNEGEVPLIIGRNVKDGKITSEIEGYISLELSEKLYRSALVEKCLVLPFVGTLKEIAIFDKKERYHLSSNVAKIEVLKEFKDSIELKYLYYYLRSPLGQLELFKHKKGSIQSNVNMKEIRDTNIILPSIEEQQKIASVLSALDDQIELNNKINQKLEDLAQTLYNYWFVQFEFPNEEGRPYKSSGGKMVWNEELKREIPEGWEVKSLSEIADFTNGLAMQKYRSSDGFASLPVIKIKEMKNGITSETERCKLDIPEKLVVKSGDILFSWSASLEVMMWTDEDGGLNQHIYKVVPKLDSKSFCYATLKNYLEYFRMIALSRKTTMGHITRDHLENSFIAIPCEDVLTKFTDFTDVCLQQIISIGEQNQELIQLRDYLLPLLMNGQVGFSDEVK